MKAEIETVPSNSLFSEDKTTSLLCKGRDFEYDTCSNEFSMRVGDQSGLVYLDPRPAEWELNTIYPENYGPYLFSTLPRWIKLARDFVQKRKVKFLRSIIPADARVLDVGCGNGALLLLMKKFGPSTWDLHANDLNMDALSALQQEGLSVHQNRIEHLDLPGFFDVIVLNQVIEHFSDVRGILSRCCLLLKPKGFLFIETPSTEGLDFRLFKQRHWGGYHFPRHFYLFNEELIKKILLEEGFDRIDISYLSSPSFWIQSLHHKLLDKGFGRISRLFTIKNIFLLGLATIFDLMISGSGGKTSNMRAVAYKR